MDNLSNGFSFKLKFLLNKNLLSSYIFQVIHGETYIETSSKINA